MFLAALALRRVGPLVGGGLERVLAETLPMVRGTSSGIWESVVWGRWFCWNLLLTSGGVLGGMLVLGLTASALQVGVRVTPQALSLKWERLSPVAGWGKLFSMDGAVRGLNTLMKLALATCIGGFVIAGRWNEIRYQSQAGMAESLRLAWDITASIAIAISAGALLWAGADYLYRWWRHEQQLRMTRQELKDEMKHEDLDPQVKARMKQAHRQAAARRALKQVPQATLVVTNPTHIAVALQYRIGQAGAPRVIAKGSGALARRIVKIARENGVPVQEMKPLARALYKQVPIGQEIPWELYHVVAEILSRLYRRKRAG